MFLQSEHIYLRALEPDDLEFLYSLENNPDIWQVSNTTTPYAKHVLQQYLEQAAADIFSVKQLRLLIHTHQHQAVGAIDLFDFEPLHQRAGLGIVIAPTYRQQHYATEALQLLLKYCREHLLLHQVFCSVSSKNVSSLRLFEKAEFSVVGTRQQWIRTAAGWQDIVEFQKILSE
ncbi:GNAT family N-acetyltransferase [Adhaeribacter radiodurans]|uniref:GNAT family N-acetyltransferase n=1 Tax=Adhaeribacter radiodurans TaxID=2745197 RepID=A0A7L7LBL0_9BACT|nr:GNAT family N-acetyltransferase [Adhaeribacter radiodurans]QMU30238.1 GNAT family N-acetyltransferase [Adhaeribacter radiodurans]